MTGTKAHRTSRHTSTHMKGLRGMNNYTTRTHAHEETKMYTNIYMYTHTITSIYTHIHMNGHTQEAEDA